MRKVGYAGVLLSAASLFAAACGSGPPPRPTKPDPLAPFVQGGKKVDFAITETKAMIQRSRGADYLPDLYMRLAELYSERARYAWLIAYERQKARGNDSRAVESPEARLLKNMAVGSYDRVLREFRTYGRAPEAMFLMAHEYRELGQFDEMKQTYEKLVEQYPTSPHRLEAYLVLGDAAFDKSDLNEAERYYQRVLAAPVSAVHPLANYKLAWVRINRGDCKGAVPLFEQILRDPKAGRKTTQTLTTQKDLDLTREALVDLAYCYPEVSKGDNSVGYFRRLAHASSDYAAAMKRLGSRYFIKQAYGQAVGAWRELLALSPPNDESVETVRKLYDGIRQGEVFDQVGEDVAQIARVYEARRFDHRLDDAARKKVTEELELYARDIATRAQVASKAKKAPVEQVATAYSVYLDYFGDAPQAAAIEENRAEVLLAAGRSYEAGRAYERLAARTKNDESRAKARTNAIAAYQQSIDGGKLTRVERVGAWTGVRSLGQTLIAEARTGEATVEIKMGVARSFYELGEYERASELFYALARQHPDSREAVASGHLALDSLRLSGDLTGLSKLGRRMINDTRLGGDDFRDQIRQIVARAEQGQVDELTVTGDSDKTEALLAMAKRHKGSSLGEEALYNTLLVSRADGDIVRFYELGEKFLAEYPRSARRPDVLSALATVATDIGDYDKAGRFLAASFAANPSAKGATDALYGAASIHAVLGQPAVAEDVRKLWDAGRQDLEPLVALLARSGNMAIVEQVLAETPIKGTVARFMRGYLAYGRGDRDAASRILSQVATESGDDDESQDAIARARFLLGELAFNDFLKAPDTGGVAESLADRSTKLQNAEKAYSAAIEGGEPRWALTAYARVAEGYKIFAEYMRSLKLPAELSSDEQKQLRGILAGKADEADARADELHKACSKRSTELVALGDGARACLGSEPLPERIAMYPDPAASAVGAALGKPAADAQQALLKDPKNARALVKLAEAYLSAGHPSVALLTLERAEKVAAKSSEIANLRGVAYVKLGEPDAAMEAFRRAVALDSGNKQARLNLAAHYAANGHKAKALSELKLAGGAPSIMGAPGEHPLLSLLTSLTVARAGSQ